MIPPENKALDLLSVEKSCLAWFGMALDRWLLASANEEDRTLSIATSWDTVEYLASSSHGAPGFYFVQDYEPWFFSLDSNFLAAEKVEAAVLILGGEVRISEAPILGCACDASSSETDAAVSGAKETLSQRLKAWMNRCIKDGVA